ncbi:MAG: radical SAM protein [Candidatus Omnitrophica bacterium]|nr:radical SAM protein [Candidatus Omnitrophota bacterium]
MKVIISYPPLNKEKGTPLLSQNRQFQYFKDPTYIYPVVPAQAASLLKREGFDVIWNDCIAMDWEYQQFIDFIKNEKPDLIAMETKTPVVKEHWKIINDIKRLSTIDYRPLTVLFGDHVTAMPEESMLNSQVDFVLTGGDYDFLLLNLCNAIREAQDAGAHYTLSAHLEPGIWYRDHAQIKSTGKFELKHDLNMLPFIDRNLTQWKSYAYKNGNYRRTPGTYIMSGRDCWWGKCTFCLVPNTGIITSQGPMEIKKIVEEGESESFYVLTHNAEFKRVTRKFKNNYVGEMLDVEIYNLKQNLQLTPNHKVYALKRSKMKRCSKRSCWDYFCVPSRISKRLKCGVCNKKYYIEYEPEFLEAALLQKGDFISVPIVREMKKVENISIKEILKNNPCFVETDKRKTEKIINEIVRHYELGYSQRNIAKLLKIDRETVKRYLTLFENDSLESKKNPFWEKNGNIKFEAGKKWIPKDIPLNKDFMRLVGYYLAEGHVSKIKNRPNSYALVLTFSEKEKEFIDDVVEIAEKLFKKVDVRKHNNKKNRTIQITISSSVLAVVFKSLFGEDCYSKKIPHNFLFLNLNEQKELIRGLFRGDGHLRIRKKGKGGSEYIYSTTSPVLAQQVLMLLFRQNLIPSYRVAPPGKKGTVDQHIISLCQYDIKNIFPELDLPERSIIFRNGFILGDYAMIPIKSINKVLYDGYVYNIEVEADHSYAANNILVSNCSWPQLYPEFRSRNPENVLDEIELLVDKFQVKEIMDDSGTFPVGKWLKEFCQGMIERGLNKRVTLDCNMRFGALSFEEYKLMQKAGFRFLLFGIESANQTTLDRIKKNLQVETIIPSCKDARLAGLYPHITIMFGYPWESYEDAQNTLKLGKFLLKKDYAYTMQSTVVVPYPGTPLFEECKDKDLLYSTNWEDYDMKSPLMKTDFSKEKLLQLVQSLYSVSYSPEFVARKILSIRGVDDVKYFGRAFLKVAGHIFDFKKNKIKK